MRLRIPALVPIAVGLVAVCAVAADMSAPDRWEGDIRALETLDRAAPPPRDAILFVGSSSIRLWDLVRSFPNLPAINRGFGGSFVSDCAFYAPRIVLPHAPRIVVFCAGADDIAAGTSPETIRDDYLSFLKIVNERLPATRIVFIAIAPSMQRWHLIDRVRSANLLIKAATASDQRDVFVDLEPAMLGADGKPRPEFFAADGLNLSAEGYALWASLLEPHLRHPDGGCSIRICDEDGAPVAGAEVTVAFTPGGIDKSYGLLTATSDEKGTVTVPPLPEGARTALSSWDYHEVRPAIIVRKDGFVTARLEPNYHTRTWWPPGCLDDLGELIEMLPRAQAPAGGAAAATLILRRGMPVRGVVLDPAGTPVANAAVAVRPASAIRSRMYASWRGDLRTNARGEFALRVPCGRVSVAAHAPPFAPCTSFQDAGEAACTLGLSQEGEPFNGIVRDWEGDPVEGARVCAMFESLTLDTVTDVRGEFRLSGLPADPAERVMIVVTAAGYDAVEKELLDCRFVSREFRLAAKPQLKATFVDCATGAPVAHTSVFLDGASLGLRTDAAGAVSFREPDFHYRSWDTPYPRYELRPWGYSGRFLFPGPATTRRVDLGILRVRKAIVLDVTFLVVDGEGRPKAGASIWTNGRCLTTDRDGRAVLCDAGNEDLSSVEVAGIDPWDWRERADELGIDITPADVAAGKKTVRVTLEPRAPDIPPADQDKPPVDGDSGEPETNAAPALTFDQIREADTVEDKERTVRGVVSTADGKPAVGAWVEYRHAALDSSSWEFVSHDPSTAAFKFVTRDAGPIDIRATRECARSVPVRVEAGTTAVDGVELRLPRTVTAAMRIVPPEPWLVGFISVDLGIGEFPWQMKSTLQSRTDVRFALTEAFASAHLSVRCPGCETRRIDFSTVAELPKEIRLVRSDASVFRGITCGPGGKRIVSALETARICARVEPYAWSERRGYSPSCWDIDGMKYLWFDAEGRCCFEVDPVGWAHVYIDSDHGTSAPIALNLQPGAIFDGLSWPIRPQGGPGSATVTFVDDKGKPFSNRSVGMHLGSRRFEESTDPLGVAYFPSLPEEAGVVSETPEVPVVISGHTSISVVCAPFLTPGTIRGRTDPLLPEVTVSLGEGDPVQPEADAEAGGAEDQAAGEEPDESETVSEPEKGGFFFSDVPDEPSEFEIGPEKPEFSFKRSPALECRLTAWSADRAWWGSAASQARSGETRDVAIKLVRTVPVSGMIELDGKPFGALLPDGDEHPDIVVAFEGEHRFLFRLSEGAFRGVVIPGTYAVRIVDVESVRREAHPHEPGYAERVGLAALPGISVARELVVAAGREVTLSSKVATGGLTLKLLHRGKAVPRGLGRVFSREDMTLVAENAIEEGTLVLAHRLLGGARFPAGSYTIQIHDRVGTFLGSARIEVDAGRVEQGSVDLDRLVPVTITATLPNGAPAVWLKGLLSNNSEAPCPVYDRDALGFLAPEGRLEGWIAAEGYELQRFGPVAIERGKENRFAARLEAGGRLFVPCTHWPRVLPKVVPCEGAPCVEDVRFEYILTAGLKDLFAPEIHAKVLGAGHGWALATRTLRAGKYRVAYCIDGTVGERVVEISVGKGTALFP